MPGNEAVAQCTKEFSDISPLTGGNIALATLEGRPSAENFEESEVLQAIYFFNFKPIHQCSAIFPAISNEIIIQILFFFF